MFPAFDYPDIPESHKMRIAENQAEFLPILVAVTPQGFVVDFDLNDEDRAAVAAGGRLRLEIQSRQFPPTLAKIVPAEKDPLAMFTPEQREEIAKAVTIAQTSYDEGEYRTARAVIVDTQNLIQIEKDLHK